MPKFESGRPDGRSNADVVFDLAYGKPPATVFTKDAMLEALGKNDPKALPTIVAKVNTRLLKACRRTLRAVPGVGYRVAEAGEHAEIASRHQASGRRKYRKAVDTLRNVNMDEMTASEKERHRAVLTVVEHHDHKIRGLEDRVSSMESVIRKFSGGQSPSGAA